jgi:hypothetical protein
MAHCHYCSNTIVFGGVTADTQLYCDDRCRESAHLLGLADKVYPDQIQKKAAELHGRPCPQCGGPGPTDVHRAHHIRSALFRSKWDSTPLLCCRRCARRAQISAFFSCLFLGWWNLPWGLLMTPVQLGRNIKSLLQGPDPAGPSPELEKLAHVGLAARAARKRSAVQANRSRFT